MGKASRASFSPDASEAGAKGDSTPPLRSQQLAILLKCGSVFKGLHPLLTWSHWQCAQSRGITNFELLAQRVGGSHAYDPHLCVILGTELFVFTAVWVRHAVPSQTLFIYFYHIRFH